MLSRLKKILFKNTGMKLLSIILAFLIWYLAAGQEKMEVGFTIPVELTNISDSVAIEGSSLQFILVRLRGTRIAIQELSLPQLRANVDLSSLKPGENYIPITNRDIEIPPGVDLVSVSPQYLSISVSARRLVPIKVKTLGKPAKGYHLVKITAIPNNIYVIGPQQKVNSIKEIDTYPINIKDIRGPMNVKADLITPDSEIRLMELKPTDVSIVVEGVTVEKVYPELPIAALEGKRAVFKPDKVTVTLSGPFNVMEYLEAGSITLTVDLPESTQTVLTGTLRATVPEGVTVIKVEPSTTLVTLPKE